MTSRRLFFTNFGDVYFFQRCWFESLHWDFEDRNLICDEKQIKSLDDSSVFKLLLLYGVHKISILLTDTDVKKSLKEFVNSNVSNFIAWLFFGKRKSRENLNLWMKKLFVGNVQLYMVLLFGFFHFGYQKTFWNNRWNRFESLDQMPARIRLLRSRQTLDPLGYLFLIGSGDVYISSEFLGKMSQKFLKINF